MKDVKDAPICSVKRLLSIRIKRELPSHPSRGYRTAPLTHVIGRQTCAYRPLWYASTTSQLIEPTAKTLAVRRLCKRKMMRTSAGTGPLWSTAHGLIISETPVTSGLKTGSLLEQKHDYSCSISAVCLSAGIDADALREWAIACDRRRGRRCFTQLMAASG